MLCNYIIFAQQQQQLLYRNFCFFVSTALRPKARQLKPSSSVRSSSFASTGWMDGWLGQPHMYKPLLLLVMPLGVYSRYSCRPTGMQQIGTKKTFIQEIASTQFITPRPEHSDYIIKHSNVQSPSRLQVQTICGRRRRENHPAVSRVFNNLNGMEDG